MKPPTPEYQPIDPFKAWSAMASAATQMLQAQARVFNSFMQSSSAYASLAASRTPSQYIDRQGKLSRAVGRSAVNMADASSTATKITARAAKSVRRKTRPKAKRARK